MPPRSAALSAPERFVWSATSLIAATTFGNLLTRPFKAVDALGGFVNRQRDVPGCVARPDILYISFQGRQTAIRSRYCFRLLRAVGDVVNAHRFCCTVAAIVDAASLCWFDAVATWPEIVVIWSPHRRSDAPLAMVSDWLAAYRTIQRHRHLTDLVIACFVLRAVLIGMDFSAVRSSIPDFRIGEVLIA